LALGSYLVNELELQNSVDTLGRWLAHHIAELIIEAQEAQSEPQRKMALARASDIILKIWKHRAVLPGHADPMSRYKSILPVLYRLRPDASPWEFRAGTNDPIDSLVPKIHRSVTRLVTGLLLLRVPELHKNRSRHSNAVNEFLSKDEADILEQLSIWSEPLVAGLPNKSGEPGPITVPKAVLSTIDEICSQLTQAREFVAKYMLNKDTDAASSKPSGPRRLQAKRRTTKPVRSSP
jgi:hypothetical protein